MGLVQIRQLEPGFRTAEWGVALGAEWWGRGLFVDAGHLLLDFAFSELATSRVEARVASRNARGNRAVEKLGAVAEGLLRGSLVVADGSAARPGALVVAQGRLAPRTRGRDGGVDMGPLTWRRVVGIAATIALLALIRSPRSPRAAVRGWIARWPRASAPAARRG